MPKFFKDHWDLNIKNVSVWHYFRFEFNDVKVTKFYPKIRVGFIDFIYLVKFVFLPFSSANNVYFICGRNDLLDLVHSMSESKDIIFIRDEGLGIKGNSFFIEAVRWFLRKLSPILFRRDFNNLKEQLNTKGIPSDIFNENLCSAVGDYYFNSIIRFFLSGKNVYFTNCIVPKIEKSQGLMNSYELQHGVIHRYHPDYAELDDSFYKIVLICWGEFWLNKLRDMNFNGLIEIGPDPYQDSDGKLDIINEVGIFTTVDDSVSKLIESYIMNVETNTKFYVQKHPRDNYLYGFDNSEKVKFVTNTKPDNYKTIIMHDSTLAFYCVRKSLYFYYLAAENEDTCDIEIRMREKYCAEINKNYSIIRNLYDVVF